MKTQTIILAILIVISTLCIYEKLDRIIDKYIIQLIPTPQYCDIEPFTLNPIKYEIPNFINYGGKTYRIMRSVDAIKMYGYEKHHYMIVAVEE